METYLNRELFVETKSLGCGVGCTPVNDPITLPRIGEYTKGWRGTMSGEKEQKGVAWWKADTYQFRINVHFKTSFLKQDKRLWNGGRGFHTLVNFCYFLLLAFQKHGLFYSESGIFCGKALQSFSLYLFILPLKMDFLIARSTLPFPLEKDHLIARLSSFLQQRLAVKSITAFGEKVMNSLV